MLAIAMQSFFIHLCYASFAVGTGWAGLAWLDHRIEAGTSSFAKRFKTMEDNSLALAFYYGLRFVGLCILAGSFVLG